MLLQREGSHERGFSNLAHRCDFSSHICLPLYFAIENTKVRVRQGKVTEHAPEYLERQPVIFISDRICSGKTTLKRPFRTRFGHLVPN